MELSPTPLRSDARANRDRILAAARTSFDADPATSLNAIARAAEVGPGTLYRHFPTREALIAAINASELACLLDVAHRLTGELPPLDALRAWCGRLIAHMRRQRGVAEMLRAALSDEEARDAYRPVADALVHLLRTAEAAGAIAPGYDPVDIQMLLSFTCQIHTAEGERRALRLVDLVLRGLAGR